MENADLSLSPPPVPASPRPPAFRFLRPHPEHPDWADLERRASAEARALLPLLERPRTGLAEHRRRARAWATAAHNWLVNRRLARAGREDLRPLYFIWTLLRACNFACTYCDDHRGRRYPDLPGSGVLDTAGALRLLEVMRTGTPSVYFAGGEPTLRDDLPALARGARDLAYYPIIINTNASVLHRRLRQPAWRTWLADTDVVIVSLDALRPAALAEMWDFARAERVLANLFLLRALAGPLGFKLMVNTVIQPGRAELAREVLDLACDLRLWFCPVPMNVGPRMHPALSADPGYRALAAKILERKSRGHRISGSLRMNRRLLHAEPLDCRNTLKPHVDHDGRLFWPCKASLNVPPVALDVLRFDSVDEIWAEGTRHIDPTGFHGPAARQCGADCNWAQNYSTDAYAHGLEHPLSLVRDLFEFVA